MVPFLPLFANSTIQRRDTTNDRLADLVHHLGGVSLVEARRAVWRNAPTNNIGDPLAIVAGALVQLRNERGSAGVAAICC